MVFPFIGRVLVLCELGSCSCCEGRNISFYTFPGPWTWSITAKGRLWVSSAEARRFLLQIAQVVILSTFLNCSWNGGLFENIIYGCILVVFKGELRSIEIMLRIIATKTKHCFLNIALRTFAVAACGHLAIVFILLELRIYHYAVILTENFYLIKDIYLGCGISTRY